MSRPNLQSASGLRPASAFFSVALVLAAVCGRSWILAMEEDHHQPTRDLREEQLPTPDFDLVDRDGQPLALSVQRMDLVLSPRAMWQAHTPELIAEELVPHLQGMRDVPTLLREFFPRAKNGVIQVNAKGWDLNFERAKAMEAWVASIGIQKELWLQRNEGRSRWRILWRPADLLSKNVRERAGWKGIRPLEWTRLLADGIAEAMLPADEVGGLVLTFKQQERRRSQVWKAMIPSADTVAIKGLPPESVFDINNVLDNEVVASHQMSIRFEHERVYPTRVAGADGEAFDVLGKWRYIDRPKALRLADEEGVAPERRDRRVRELLDIRHPVSGLEGMAARLLGEPEFDFIRKKPASYSYRRVVAVHQASRRYFRGDSSEDPTPRVQTTLDSGLQRFLLKQLEYTMEDNRAAGAMGIVVDVETGDVLAVGGTTSEEMFEFMPTWHKFSPGSTFKVVAMATALEAGVVTPNEKFDTHNGHYRVPGSARRVIREAQGAPRGTIPAWEGISRSVNSVLVQIGMRVPDEFFHRKLMELGYGSVRGAGIGTETAGYVPDLPWSPAFTHASISFGHELSVNLWQHAEALATILRGGIRRPLRMMRGVEWDDRRIRLGLVDGKRVFRPNTCSSIRGMLAEGALTGTGRRITAAEAKLGTPIELLSKTGTTEKEGGVACLHNELKRNAHNSALPGGRQDPGFITFKAAKDAPPPHSGSCYTSSICLVGRVQGEGRELMVLIVVEEPREDIRFGSDVAGPAAIAVLKEGLGLTDEGIGVTEVVEVTPDYGHDGPKLDQDEPWRLPFEDADDYDDGAFEEEREESQ
jgi:cell division protein FtsI/penicillin-binding protein 2